MRGRDEPVARRGGQHLGQQPLAFQVDRRRVAAQMVGGHLRPDRAVELVAGVTEQDQRLPRLVAQLGGNAAGDVVDHAEDADHRGGQDRGGPGLVVETDVAPGDRDAQRRGAVGQPPHRMGELPHHARVLRGPEVQAVGHRDRRGTGDRDVAVGLGQRELRAGVGVELGVAARGVGGDRDTSAGLLVDPQHAAVCVLGEHRVAAHVPVVLLGDEGPAAQVRAADHGQQRGPQLVARAGPGQRRRRVGVERVLGVRPFHGPLVDGPLVRDGAWRHVHHRLTVPGDFEPVPVGDLTDHRGQHIPLAAHLEERVDVGRCHHRAHALLRFAGQDLRGGHVGRAQRHPVQLDPHPTVPGGGQLRCGTGQSSAAQVLDADHEVVGVELEAALDENLLGERITDLHAGQLLSARRA